LVVPHDSDGQAGDVRPAQQVCCEIIQPTNCRVDLSRWNDIGGGLRRRHRRIHRNWRYVGLHAGPRCGGKPQGKREDAQLSGCQYGHALVLLSQGCCADNLASGAWRWQIAAPRASTPMLRHVTFCRLN
jgi:hypothetical protein